MDVKWPMPPPKAKEPVPLDWMATVRPVVLFLEGSTDVDLIRSILTEVVNYDIDRVLLIDNGGSAETIPARIRDLLFQHYKILEGNATILDEIEAIGIIRDVDDKYAEDLLKAFQNKVAEINRKLLVSGIGEALSQPSTINKVSLTHRIRTGVYLMPGPDREGSEMDDLLYEALPEAFRLCASQYRSCLQPTWQNATRLHGKHFREYYMKIQEPRVKSIAELLQNAHIKVQNPLFQNVAKFLTSLVGRHPL